MPRCGQSGRSGAIEGGKPYLNGCKIIHDSDAHYLEHIHEREQFLTAASAKPADVLEALTGKSLTSGVGVI